ncbi:TonB-dependent receptor plug domain-containing protein [Phenylobacterium sp.]|uniref:TonB-dependent receptor plug domain-containing protein n=1 Tax=Phenylobacterium sp. TaxID=1871053 RepID=UPI0035B46E1E
MQTKFRRRLWLAGAAAVAVCSGAGGAWAQSTDVGEVIVTGTRQTGLRAVDSPAPVQVLDSTALERVGQTDLIQAIAQNIPSFNAQAFGGDTANLTLSAKLRGLSPNHALILINGKRRHGTANLAVLGGPFQGGATADLNFIPLGAVGHIEVLQEGAAAQYGSDAIAGVVNVILKDNVEGGSIVGSAGKYMDGGGKTADLMINAGFAPVENSYLNLTYNTRWHGHSFRGDVDPRVIDTPYNTTSTSRLSRYPQLASHPDYPYLNRIAGDAEYRLHVLSYNAGYTFENEVELYSFGTYGNKYAAGIQNYRVPNLVVGRDGSVPFPLGFSPKETFYEDDWAGTLGVRGELAGWSWDLASTYGKDDIDVYNKGSINRSLYIDTSTTTAPGQAPVDTYNGSFIATQWTTQLDLAKDYDVGMAGPMTVAFGGEYREDSYEIKPGDAASRYKEGQQAYPGFALTDAGKHSRHSYGVYANVALEPAEGLKLDLASRYEKYSDFGDTLVFKGTGRYDFSEVFAIRGTASTGFRAPTLAETYYSATNVSPTSAFVQLPPGSAAARLVGVDGLDAEKSRNFSVGFVSHPGFGITATLDLYQITIKDRIVGSGSLFGSGGSNNIPAVTAAILANGNVLDPTVTQTGINIFTNGLNTRTRGAELVITLPSDFGPYGSVQWALTGNYTKTEVTKIAAPPPELTGSAGPASLFDLTAIGNLETTAPKYRLVASALWTLGPLQVSLKESLYGPSSRYDSRVGCPLPPATSARCYKSTIKTALITDLEVSYEVREGVKLTVGANNLFNYYPDRLNYNYRFEFLTGNANGYVTQYPTWSPFGINGGYYYGKLAYTF